MEKLFTTQSEVDGVEELVRVDFVFDLEMIFSLRRSACGDSSITIAVIGAEQYVLLTPFDVVLAAWKKYMSRVPSHLGSLN